MTKIKQLILLLCVAGSFAACKNDENFDFDQQFRTDTTLIRKYITDNKIPALKNNTTGLFYQILEPGQGSISYTPNTMITAQYAGKLLNGTQFDATTPGKNATFALGQVIEGWRLGIPLIQKGGKIRLIIPSLLGYRNQPAGIIPANSVLDFTVTLTNAENQQ